MNANPILLQKKYSRVIECFARAQGILFYPCCACVGIDSKSAMREWVSGCIG